MRDPYTAHPATPPDVLRHQIMLTVHGARPELGTDGAGEVADALRAAHDVTLREAEDGSGGAQGGSAVPVEGSGAQAGSQGVTEADRERAWQVLCALPISIPGYSPETVRKAQDRLAAALAEERARGIDIGLQNATSIDHYEVGHSCRLCGERWPCDRARTVGLE